MWVLMTKTYAGALGVFPADQKIDLPEDIIEKLPKNSFKKICAPWDEQKDTKAIKKAELIGKAKSAILWADILQQKADKLYEKANSLVAGVTQKQKEAVKTKAVADKVVKIAEKKSASDDDKRQAFDLAREAERKNNEHLKAAGELAMALADARLKQMEAEDAKQNAKELAEQAGIPFDEPVDKQVDEPVDQSVDESADQQDAGIPEGQAVSAGQEGQ